MATKWKKALNVLQNVPVEKRTTKIFYDGINDRYCAATALALAIQPDIAGLFKRNPYHAEDVVYDIVGEHYGMWSSGIVDILDRYGWDALLESISHHNSELRSYS